MSIANKCCAFLRGVNVRGTTMKLDAVCLVFVNAGVINVSSILASGNIIFESDAENRNFKENLEKAKADFFKYDTNFLKKIGKKSLK